MRSISLKSAFISLTAAALLLGCSQPPNYAPVKTVNQALTPKNGYTPSPPPRPSNYNRPESRQTADKPYSPAAPEISGQQPVTAVKRAELPEAYPHPAQNYPLNAKEAGKTSHNPELYKPPPAKFRASPGDNAQNKTRNSANPNGNTASKSISIRASGQAVTKNINNPGRQKDSQIARSKPGKSGQNDLKPQQPEKISYQEKSILSIDNKKMLKLNFGWPLKGRITRNFAQTDHKGIDITGRMGQEFHAAEAGKAVYCGQGLAGFGNLAVIKHNESYLTAYANASRLFIKEGQRIGKGEAIGKVGNSGFKRALLHFEIRKNGKSINPLTVLPKH